jgi:hypothetical protein
MGTNFYGRIIPTEKHLKVISEAVLDGNLRTAKEMIEKHEIIHIGESSARRRFLFNHNNWKYFSGVQEMKNWLKDLEIVSEYGGVVPFEEFWSIVEEKQKTQNPITDKSWYTIKEGYEFSTPTEFF